MKQSQFPQSLRLLAASLIASAALFCASPDVPRCRIVSVSQHPKLSTSKWVQGKQACLDLQDSAAISVMLYGDSLKFGFQIQQGKFNVIQWLMPFPYEQPAVPASNTQVRGWR